MMILRCAYTPTGSTRFEGGLRTCYNAGVFFCITPNVVELSTCNYNTLIGRCTVCTSIYTQHVLQLGEYVVMSVYGCRCKSVDVCSQNAVWILYFQMMSWFNIELCIHLRCRLLLTVFNVYVTKTAGHMHKTLHRNSPVLTVMHCCCCSCCVKPATPVFVKACTANPAK